MAAAEKKAAAAAGAPSGDWWDAFCRRMSGACVSPSPVCLWLPVALAGGRACLSPLGFVADCAVVLVAPDCWAAIGSLCRVREELRR